jgi:hypothetical protein
MLPHAQFSFHDGMVGGGGVGVQRSTAVSEEQQQRFRGIYHVKRTTVEAEFLDEIQTKAEFSSLLFKVTSTGLLEISISSNSRNLLKFL